MNRKHGGLGLGLAIVRHLTEPSELLEAVLEIINNKKGAKRRLEFRE